MENDERNSFLLTLGKRIRKCRNAANLTQEELAALLGYEHKTSISAIERGINDIPQSKIQAFANALNTSPEYLMGWTENESSQNQLAPKRPFSPEEQSLIFAFRRASDRDKDIIRTILKAYGLAEEPIEEDTSSVPA